MCTFSHSRGWGFARSSPGFTLIELLVVIAVISILAGLLLPAIAGAKSKTQSVACLANQRQLALACLLYTGDATDRLPYNLGTSDIKRSVSQGQYLNWTSPIMNWELDQDNTNTVLLTEGGLGPYVSRERRVYLCPKDLAVSDIQSAAGWVRRTRSVSMNMMIGDAGEFTKHGENVNNPDYKQFFKASQVPKPSQIFVFIEEHPDSINDGYFWNRAHSRSWLDLPAAWHAGGANISYADGHSEHHKWRFASTQPPHKPDAARLPFYIPPADYGDFQWLMGRMSTDEYESGYISSY